MNNEMLNSYQDTLIKYKIALDALGSIAHNSCCETCQQAKLVALAALKKITTGPKPE